MTLRQKTINGKKYLYAERSFRLPDGTVKKISKLVKSSENEALAYYDEKYIEVMSAYMIRKYGTDSIITREKIQKFETYKRDYRKIVKKLTKKQLEDLLDRFTANFTYESNAIEGNSLTLKDVTLILNENIMPRGKDLREIFETRNTRVANELLFSGKVKISVQDIVKLHETLVKDTDVQVGFKKLPNFLLMRNVKTTPPELVEREMTKLVKFYHESTMHPLKLAAEFHGKFEQIHPFEDGNGRVGRILINAILFENNYPPLIIRKTMRQSYFTALEAFDKGYKNKLQRFILTRLEQTYKNFFEEYVKYV